MQGPVVLVCIEPLLRCEVVIAIFIPELVISLPLFGIAQDLVGLGKLLEILSGLLITRVLVRMLNQSEFAVRFLDLLRRRTLL